MSTTRMPVSCLIEKVPPMAIVISAARSVPDRFEREADLDLRAVEELGIAASEKTAGAPARAA